jgi:hypothetical protein
VKTLAEAGSSAERELLLEWAENLSKNQRSKKRAEGAPLSKAFCLKEAIPCTEMIDVPAFIVGVTDGVKEREKRGEVL